MFSKLSYRPGCFLLLILCASLVGCSGGKGGKAKVSGRVKYFDKYLTAGTVAFVSADGRVGSANIDADGNYEMVNAPIGDVTITVQVPQAIRDPRIAGGAKPPPGVPEMHPPGEVGGSKAPGIDPSKIVAIPKKYEDAKTSGLKYTVEKGEQTYNITLTP
jgi:hypothetical protein